MISNNKVLCYRLLLDARLEIDTRGQTEFWQREAEAGSDWGSEKKKDRKNEGILESKLSFGNEKPRQAASG